ncbi:DUF3772 domain-containing protein [Aliiroseovarius sediminis]|uniref:DUF3772 domain-containing protein n=1 Tax=Aliiroseovarius sediminis TaxID=2925839 RepID=UPI001F59F7BB|nr:DUF3772 domain-containing protein [Aliiroseovarius sediminis]MCI2393111.1 DUF3772 domain-containing protein [Aliiroseovarius sediminis]
MTRALTAIFAALLFALTAFAAVGQNSDASSEEARTAAYEVLDDGSPDYEAWERLASQVEDAIELERASDADLEKLRAALIDWRNLFSEAQKENSIRIDTLKTQLSTLGAEPEAPEEEPEVLTQRRRELTERLNAARLPVQEAQEAYSRADVLIREIDAQIRARQTDQILALGPSPLNPALWPRALSDLKTTLDLSIVELRDNWGSESQRQDLRDDLPVTLTLLAIAVVLLFRSRVWIMRLGKRMRAKRKGSSRGVIGFLTSIGQFLAPLTGLFAFIAALNLAGVLGLRGQVIADVLPGFGFVLFGSHWLGTRLFTSHTGSSALIDLPNGTQRTEARVNVGLLGLALGVWAILTNLAAFEEYSSGTVSVLAFPVLLATGYLLARTGRTLRQYVQAHADRDGMTFRERAVLFMGRVCQGVGLGAPIAAAIGYTNLAASILFPSVMTMAVIAVLALLHSFLTGLYGVLRNLSEDEAQQALLPVLMTVMMVILSLPLLALLWGVRAAELAELWATFQHGFQLGEARVTPRTLMVFALIFAIGYAATRAAQSALRTTILPKTKLDKGGQNAISVGVGYVGLFLAAVIAITSAGIDLSSVAIVAGALSVGIGFGLQTIVSNFVSGIILLIERPISEGDWIEVGGEMGYVRDISVRATRIETFDRTDVILPNSDLVSGVVTNFTRGNSIGRVIVPVRVAYGNDTRRIETILMEIAENHPMVTVNPPPSVVFQGFGADCLEFEIRAILSDVNYMLSVKSEINHEIASRFAEEGIEIPHAQRDIWLRNPEALAVAAGDEKQTHSDDATARSPSNDALTVEDMHRTDDSDGESDGGDD